MDTDSPKKLIPKNFPKEFTLSRYTCSNGQKKQHQNPIPRRAPKVRSKRFMLFLRDGLQGFSAAKDFEYLLKVTLLFLQNNNYEGYNP